MRIIFFLLLFSISFLYAGYDPTANIKDIDFSNDPADIRVHNVQINEDISISKYEDISVQQAQDKINKQKEVLNSRDDILKGYFIEYFEYTKADDFSCPPLKNSTNYGVIVDNVNYFTGGITCSVYEKPYSNFNSNQKYKDALIKPIIKRVLTKTFTNKEYIKTLNVEGAEAFLSKDAIEATELFEEQLQAAKQALKYKYNGYSDNGLTILDMSDAIDAVMTMNTEIIDLQASFNSNSLVFRDGYFVNYLDEEKYLLAKQRKEKLSQITKEINEQYSFMPQLFKENPQKEIEDQQNYIEKLLSNKLNMIIYFIVKYHYVSVFFLIAFMIAASPLFIYNIFKYQIDNKEIGLIKILFTITTAVILLLANTTQEQQIVQDKLTDKEYIYETSKIQDLVNVLSQESNYFADLVGEAIIDSYTSTLFSNVATTTEEIKYVAKDYLKNKIIKENTSKVLAICYNTFDTFKLKYDNEKLFKQLDTTAFIPDSLALNNRNYSIYNTTQNGGYVKDINLFNQTNFSLNVCANSSRILDAITKKINYQEKRIDAFNNLEIKDKVYLQKQLLIEKIYDNFYSLGYIATPFITVLDAYQKIIDLPSRKAEEWSNLILNFDIQQMSNFAAENWILMLSIGSPVQEFVTGLTKLATDSTLGFIPFVGEIFSSITSKGTGYIASILFVDLIDELIPALRGLFMWAIAAIMFFLMFIAKFVVYWSLPFLALYGLATNSVEKFSRTIIKTVITFSKPIILLFVLFLATFIMDLNSNFMFMFIDQMTNDLSGGTIQTLGAHIIKSIAKLFALVLEFIICFYLIVKGTSVITQFFEINSNDIADVLIDSVSSAIQNKAIR